MESNNNSVPSEASAPEKNEPKIQSISIDSTETPQQSPTPEPTPAKSSKAVIWCLAIIAIIGIIVAGIFAYLYFTTPNNPASIPNDNKQSSTTSNESTAEEIEITDTLLKKDLDEKIAVLHDTTQTDATIKKGTVIGGYSDRIFKMYKTGYPDPASSRIACIINELEPQFRYLTAEESNVVIENIQPEYREDIKKESLKGIDGDIVSKRYKEVFGNELSHESSNDCYDYLYNSSYDIYYHNPIGGCGGTSPFKTFHYKNKYTTNNNNAYVYISVALSDAEDNNVYCDISYLDIQDSFELADNAKVCGTISGNEDFVLDESNYKDFAQYRFIFSKADDDTYYFVKVEKL